MEKEFSDPYEIWECCQHHTVSEVGGFDPITTFLEQIEESDNPDLFKKLDEVGAFDIVNHSHGSIVKSDEEESEDSGEENLSDDKE